MYQQRITTISTLIALMLMGPALADGASNAPEMNHAGEVAKVEGKVYLHQGEAVRGERIREAGKEIKVGQGIRTKRRSRAFIAFIDGSKVILQERSLLSIDGIDLVKTGEGRVLFQIKPQGGVKGLKVVTKSAIIGVKGTEFMVDAEDEEIDIFLRSGKLEVQPVEGEFARYKKKTLSDYEAYMHSQKEQYETYKRKQEEEFLEYVRSVEMGSFSAISISGKEVRDIEITPEIEAEFELFKSFAQLQRNTPN